MRVAVKLAYDGTRFHGFERQPDVRTVEGTLLKSMTAAGVIDDTKEARFQKASRTDAGVSALGNVIAFDTRFRMEDALSAANAHLEDIWLWGVAAVPWNFHPRQARQRWYRYHLAGEHDVEALRGAASLFLGRHNFRNFARVEGKDVVRTVDVIDIAATEGLVTIDVRARSFLWHMVRRIVAALERLERGETKEEEVREALRGGSFDFGLAPAEPLFLMDVDYGFPFHVPHALRLRDRLQAPAEEARLRHAFFESLTASLGPTGVA